MELKLNIYDDAGEVIKTYTAETFRLKTGTCEDLLEIIEVDKLKNISKMTEDEAMQLMGMMVGMFKQFKPIMKQVFRGLTDEEYRNTDMDEVGAIAWEVIQYTIGQLFKASKTSGKN